ncbi:hypothetical protein DPEC_G00358800 [Dallia pectoralis]|uniref:Uncharacterized protein n=1 Tax=Dallia pectoralis TaxID=75939 RepID=A0ACC2F0G0_DALPE|nr:hypothetical protein DPEC_G00358800 [Dallia pectoralis]
MPSLCAVRWSGAGMTWGLPRQSDSTAPRPAGKDSSGRDVTAVRSQQAAQQSCETARASGEMRRARQREVDIKRTSANRSCGRRIREDGSVRRVQASLPRIGTGVQCPLICTSSVGDDIRCIKYVSLAHVSPPRGVKRVHILTQSGGSPGFLWIRLATLLCFGGPVCFVTQRSECTRSPGSASHGWCQLGEIVPRKPLPDGFTLCPDQRGLVPGTNHSPSEKRAGVIRTRAPSDTDAIAPRPRP